MKKLLLTTAILLGVNTYSQITDLESLLNVCNASISDLNNLNSYGWQIIEPDHSKNKESVIDINCRTAKIY